MNTHATHHHNYNIDRIRRFLSYLNRAMARHKKRTLIKGNVYEQLEHIKRLDLKKLDREGMVEELIELQERIDEALEHEKKHHTPRVFERFYHEELIKRIAKLDERLDNYIKIREEQLRRYDKLEGKIAARLAKK